MIREGCYLPDDRSETNLIAHIMYITIYPMKAAAENGSDTIGQRLVPSFVLG